MQVIVKQCERKSEHVSEAAGRRPSRRLRYVPRSKFPSRDIFDAHYHLIVPYLLSPRRHDVMTTLGSGATTVLTDGLRMWWWHHRIHLAY